MSVRLRAGFRKTVKVRLGLAVAAMAAAVAAAQCGSERKD